MKFIKFLTLILLFSSCAIFAQQEKEFFLIVKDQNNKPISNAVILFDDIKQPGKTNEKGVFKTSINSKLKKITAFSPLHGIKTIGYHGKKYNRVIITKQLVDAKIDKPSNVVAQGSMSSFQYKDIYDYLNGQVPGVVIINKTITIRGNNTINGNNAPLLVVNRTPVGADLFGNISPIDIKHVKVLKGPETTIYGVRGANGVIEVTTN